MAHVAKYTASAVGHMANHYGRSDVGEKANYIVRSNENIKPERTHLNYNLAKDYQPMKQVDFLRRRLSEVKVQKRSDVNVLCDWVVTAPKDLPPAELEQFFVSTHDFLATKYGRENVVSAYVHMDEVTPHIHFAFIPVVPDRRKGGYKVSAKECITRAQLRSFHSELQERLEHDLGHSVAILNDATAEGNKSIADLKRGTATKLMQEAKQNAADAVYKLQEAKEQAQNVKDSLIPVRAEYEAKKAYIERISLFSDRLNLPEVKPKKAILGFGRVKSYTVPAEIWKKASASLNADIAERVAQEKWYERMQGYSKTSVVQENKQLRQKVKELESKIDELNVVQSRQAQKNDELSAKNIALIADYGNRQKFQERVLERVLNRISPNFSHTFYEFWKQEEQAEKRLQAYRNKTHIAEDRYTIYQLKEENLRDFGFLPYKTLAKLGQNVSKDRYQEVYSDVLEPSVALDELFRRLNADHPNDFSGRSLSVSDVVVLHQHGQDTAYYCDLLGWQEVPEFLGQRYQTEIERVMERDDDELEI